jgi:hypothetical protein
METIRACAFSDEPDTKGYSVFSPEIIHQPDKIPFFLSYHSYYGDDSYAIPATTPTITGRNTAEWVAFFDQKIKPEDIEWLVYNSKTEELELIRRNFAGEKTKIDTFNKNTLSQIKSAKNSLDAVDYIILAKKTEKLFNPDYDSWEPLTYDSSSITKWIPVFKSKFSAAKNKFLRDRYGFQVTRALCLTGQFDECIDFFDNSFKPTKESGSMYFRSLGFKARAFYKKQNYSQSNYLYSSLYEQDPCSKYSAFQSFHPLEEADWTASLSLAKSTREKEVLWHLFGIYADPLRGMKEIYSLNPKSDLLPLLLVRSVNLAEQTSLNNPLHYDNFYAAAYQARSALESEQEIFKTNMDSSSQIPLLEFINKVIREKKTGKLSPWQLSSAYLSLLNGSLQTSGEVLSSLSIDPKDTLVLGQAEILKGILDVKKTTIINSDREKLIYTHIQKILSFPQPELRKDNAVRYMLTLLSGAYSKKQDLLKTELCYPEGEKFYQSAVSIQHMIDFMNKKDLNGFEKYVVGQYPLKLADLYKEKAVALMYNYQFAEATREFEKSKESGSEELYGNPFTIHVTDCHDCDHIAQQKTKYSKYVFAKKMIELKAKGDTAADAQERAQNYFLYANGLYNMTWYGNARFAHDSRIFTDDYYTLYEAKEGKQLRKSNFFNCNEAMTWYQKALSLSKDKEFRAKCTWMSAKCEHNIWLGSLDTDGDLNKDFVAGKYFNQMKNEYADTRYYKEAINECGYFCTFINPSDKCIRNK